MSDIKSNLEKLSELIITMQEKNTVNSSGRKDKRKIMREYNHLQFKASRQISRHIKNAINVK
jgi:hypothetical protein